MLNQKFNLLIKIKPRKIIKKFIIFYKNKSLDFCIFKYINPQFLFKFNLKWELVVQIKQP